MSPCLGFPNAGEFGGDQSEHGPRVLVAAGTIIAPDRLKDAVSVTLTDPPRVVGTLDHKLQEQAMKFVNANREVLLRYWHNEISTPEMIDGLVQLGGRDGRRGSGGR